MSVCNVHLSWRSGEWTWTFVPWPLIVTCGVRAVVMRLRRFTENIFIADSKVEELAISNIVTRHALYFLIGSLIGKWIECTKKFYFTLEFSQEKKEFELERVHGSWTDHTIFREPINSNIIL